ncbi:hypothetical protein VP01_5671g1, partial [Puccinia sorghi]
QVTQRFLWCKLINSKGAHTIIRIQQGTHKLFKNSTPMQIIQKVNQPLISLNSRIDNTPSQIQAVTCFPSEDIKFIMTKHMTARWLLDYQHIYNPTYLDLLCSQNSIPCKMIESAFWRTTLNKWKETQHSPNYGASINDIPFREAKYTSCPSPCIHCLVLGHLAHYCKKNPICTKCGGKHNSEECSRNNLNGFCFHCITADQTKKRFTTFTNIKYIHSPFSLQCPMNKEESEKIHSSL